MILYGDPLSDLIRGEICRTQVRRRLHGNGSSEDEGGVGDGGERLDEAGDHQRIGLRDDLYEAAMEK